LAKPEFIDVLRMPTNVAWVAGRSFAAHTPESKSESIAVLDQMRMIPLSANKPGQQTTACKAEARNAVFPPGVTAEAIAADPYAFRPEWVNPKTFWDDLEKMLAANPTVGPADAGMADQARTLIALRKSDAHYKSWLDRAALAADASLHESSSYARVGVDAGNGWQRQKDGGVWGSDWFGRAQAAVIYIMVNDHREAIYFIRGTDAKGALLDGRNTYTMTFAKDALPPMDRTRGGFWSLTMYDKDYFMLPNSPNGRTNVGTVNLDANELKFAPDGSHTITMSHAQPTNPVARANWLPAPEGQFALIVRAYVPTEQVQDGTYKLPNVEPAPTGVGSRAIGLGSAASEQTQDTTSALVRDLYEGKWPGKDTVPVPQNETAYAVACGNGQQRRGMRWVARNAPSLTEHKISMGRSMKLLPQ
jgi:hypothetical protein